MNIMVIRTDKYDREWLWNNIQKGNLKQGWGVPELQLKENSEVVSIEVWKERYKQNALKFWNEELSDGDATKRYGILYPMIELKEEDIVVIPRMPQNDTFAVAKVKEGYSFDYEPADKRGSREDYRHNISIKEDSLKYFNYSSSDEAKCVRMKMRAYQSAVNRVLNPDFAKAITALSTKNTDLNYINPTEIFKSSIASEMLSKLRSWPPLDLERIVIDLFKNNGYDISETHRYDKQGGDVDIIATTKLPLLSNCCDEDYKVYIQVKNKNGQDWDDVKGVKQLLQISQHEQNVKKILLSTADGFSDNTKNLAKENDVLLINGEELAQLILNL